MGLKKQNNQLAKFLEYILGRRPDEFGLVPDKDGFIKLKDFFMAIAQEEGWRHVRQPLINELLLTMTNPPVEIVGKQIRATNRDQIPKIQHAVDIPKLLYTTVTQKSHAVVLENGIHPTRYDYIILASDREMALRIGKRRDRSPVLLTVNIAQTEKNGIFFKQAGEKLYLADMIPVNCFTAPPLPKEKPETQKPKKPKEPERSKTPGSYTIDLQSKKEKAKKAAKDKNGSWKRNKKRLRRQKKEEWPFNDQE